MVEGAGWRTKGHGEIVLRNWRMPVLAAALCLTVWPLTGAVLLAVVVSLVAGWE